MLLNPNFEEDGTQNYLVFQPVNKYFKLHGNTDYISSWTSKGLSSESIKPPTTSNNSLTPIVNYYGTKKKSKIYWTLFKTIKNVIYSWKNSKYLYVYELGASSSHVNDPTLKSCLFGAVNLNKNADIDKYVYSRYGIGFDRRSSFSFTGVGFGQNILILGVDMSSSVHIDNKKKIY